MVMLLQLHKHSQRLTEIIVIAIIIKIHHHQLLTLKAAPQILQKQMQTKSNRRCSPLDRVQTYAGHSIA